MSASIAPELPPGLLATAEPRPPAGLVHDVQVLCHRGAQHALGRGGILAVIAQSVLFFAIFYCAYERMLGDHGVRFGPYVTPTVVVQALMFIAIADATSLAADVNSGFFRRLRTMPVAGLAVPLSRSITVATQALAATVVISLVAHLTGFRFSEGVLPTLGYLVLSILFVMALTAATTLAALTLRNQESLSAVLFLPYLPLLILSTGFVSADLFPGWLQPFVRYSPVSAVIDAQRHLTSGTAAASTVVVAFGWCLAIIVVVGILDGRAFRKVQK